MKWDLTLNLPEELENIGDKLIKSRRSAPLHEQWQMSRLLEAASSASIFEFPIQIRHTGEQDVPDFQIKSGERQIAVELAIISTQDLECARGLQKRKKRKIERAMNTTNLLRMKAKPRTEDEILADAFAIPARMHGLSIEERHGIWIKQANAQLSEKTAVLRGEQFEHGDEDCIVIRDKIGTRESEVKLRMGVAKELLASYWQEGWYSRVFIQQIGRWPFLAVFSKTGVKYIPQNFVKPILNYPPNLVFTLSQEDELVYQLGASE